MSSDEYYRVDRDRIHRCAESLIEQGFAPGDALQVALMQEVALIAEYVCNLCCMAFHGLSPDRARRMALSEWPHVEYVDFEGRRFPAARCGGNGALIDLSVWPRRIWRD